VNQQRFFAAVLSALEGCGIPYMVAGSVASILCGEPRLTNDMDVVVELEARHVDNLLAQFAGENFHLPSAEFIREVIARGGAFNIIHPASASKVDLIVRKRTDFAVQEFARRRRLPFTDQQDASVATPEDVILAFRRLWNRDSDSWVTMGARISCASGRRRTYFRSKSLAASARKRYWDAPPIVPSFSPQRNGQSSMFSG
jgi:hypothetical protein